METNNQYILVNLYDMINSYYTFRGCREKKLTYTDRKTVQVTEIFRGFHRESAAATRRPDGEDREGGGGERDDDRREELQTTINRQPESLWICLYLVSSFLDSYT